MCAVKRRIATAQNIHDNSQGPDVARYVVFDGAKNLRGNVVGRVAGGYQAAVDLFGKAEVGQLDHRVFIVS